MFVKGNFKFKKDIIYIKDRMWSDFLAIFRTLSWKYESNNYAAYVFFCIEAGTNTVRVSLLTT